MWLGDTFRRDRSAGRKRRNRRQAVVLDVRASLDRPRANRRYLVLAFVVRTGRLRYRAIAGMPLHVPSTGDRERDIQTLTVDLNRQLETVVRRYPEQYLWMHRRWRPPSRGRPSDGGTVGPSDGSTD